MVIHEHSQEDLFWIAYSIAGVGLPLALYWIQEKISNKIRGYKASVAAQAQ
jgi:hypothetical protein